MLVSRLIPNTNSRSLFEWSSAMLVPDAPGCYTLATHDDIIVYVGQATNLNRRLRDHLASDDKRSRTRWGYARWFSYRLCDASELSQLENAWVQQFKLANRGSLPTFNQVEPPSM